MHRETPNMRPCGAVLCAFWAAVFAGTCSRNNHWAVIIFIFHDIYGFIINLFINLQKNLKNHGNITSLRTVVPHINLHACQSSRHDARVSYHDPGHERRAAPVYRKARHITALIILIVFTFAGQFIFMFFGISTNGFRIAGGVIIFKIGYYMLQARYTHVKLNSDEIKTYANDISITPLGIPMLCGPGAIANTIVLMSDAHTITMKSILIGSIVFIYVLTYFILRASTRLVSVLGETGNNVMMRLMGLLLMVIAVECFVGGMKPILIDIISQGTAGA